MLVAVVSVLGNTPNNESYFAFFAASNFCCSSALGQQAEKLIIQSPQKATPTKRINYLSLFNFNKQKQIPTFAQLN